MFKARYLNVSTNSPTAGANKKGISMESLQARIIRHEGFCRVPKPDAKGMWVVGYGHDIPARNAYLYSNGISIPEALELLKTDIEIARSACNSAIPWIMQVDETRRGILYEMAFQMGVKGLLQFQKTLSAIRDERWDDAVKEMLNSQWHTETPQRCEELAGIMLSGELP